MTYREYLEAKYLDDFDAWRGKYSNPFRDLQDDGRSRNWDDDRRISDLEADGVVAEVVFPNTVPPFFPTGTLVSPQPTADNLEHRLAGIRAHNRWLADFCKRHPERRAGIAQIFLNDIDEAIKDITFIAENGLRGGMLLPGVPPDRKDIEPLYSPAYDPIWAACQDMGVIVNHHSGSGSPDYGKYGAAGVMWIAETAFFSHRALSAMLVSGVFERFPKLTLVLTEQGGAWVPPMLDSLDYLQRNIRDGRVGELGFPAENKLSMLPSEYFQRNVWIGLSFPPPSEVDARYRIGVDKIMWGNDYPHHEACWPNSREHLQRSFSEVSETEMRQMMTTNIAQVYNFDVAALDVMAASCGPTPTQVREKLAAIPQGARSPAFFKN